MWDRIHFTHYFTVGLKIWSNALALRYDPYHSCYNFCTYCFARQMERGSLKQQGKKYNPKIGRVSDIKLLAKELEKAEATPDSKDDFITLSVKKRWPIEVGTMGEPTLEIDKQLRVFWNFVELMKSYDIPIFLNTKGNLLVKDESYFNLVCELGKNVIVDVPLVFYREEFKRKFEPKAPSVADRLKLMKELSEVGIYVVHSLRPIIKGYTDKERDLEKLVEKVCEAGVKAIHPRTLIVTGHMLKVPFWKRYVKESGMVFKDFQYRYTVGYLLEIINRIKPICESYEVDIVASHTLFFLLPNRGLWNKCDFEKAGWGSKIFPITIVPLLRPAKKSNKPTLLTFDRLEKLLKQYKELADRVIYLKHNRGEQLIWASSCMCKFRREVKVKFRDIVIKSLWDGWFGGFGYIANLKGIYVVCENGKPIRDSKGHLVYFYKPPTPSAFFNETTHTTNVSKIELKEVERYVKVRGL